MAERVGGGRRPRLGLAEVVEPQLERALGLVGAALGGGGEGAREGAVDAKRRDEVQQAAGQPRKGTAAGGAPAAGGAAGRARSR